MFKKTLLSLAVASSLGLTGCFDSAGSGKNASPDYKISNPAIDGQSYPRFNPIIADEFIEQGKALPIPNDLLFQQANPRANPPIKSDGTFSDATSAEPTPPEVALGYLDGISTVAPIDLPFEGSIDPESVDSTQFLDATTPNPNQNVFLLELAYPGGDPLQSVTFFVHKDADVIDGISNDELTPNEADALINLSTGLPQTKSVEIPVPAIAAGATPVDFRHEVISLDGGTNNYLRITPLKPLKPQTRYLVVVTNSITDAAGDPIGRDPLYNSVADPAAVLGNAGALAPVRDAALGWQSLAEAYFGAATNQVREAQSLPALSRDNVALSFTATTGGTTAVLDAYANPATFFEASLRKDAKQAGIEKLVKGQLTLSAAEVGGGFPSGNVAAEDQCLNAALIGTVTDDTSAAYIPVLDPASANYDASITSFAQLPNNTFKAFAQSAVAQVNESIENDEVTIAPFTCGDGVTFAQEAGGTVGALGAAVPAPSSRSTAFYTSGVGAQPSAAFGLPETTDIHLGQIELPYFLEVPADSSAAEDLGTPWKANTILGGAIDSARGNDAGTTPPTNRVTYRYPFAGGDNGGTQVTAPVLLQTPVDSGTADGGGGLPVVIYQHGIFGERGHALALGNQLANAGFAVLSIDLPLHGVAPFTANGDENPLLALSVDVDPANPSQDPAFKAIPGFENVRERHFGYTTDAQQNVVEIQYGANASGSSGSNFLNLQALQTSRDALRQAAVDLMNLNASIATIDFDGDTTPDLDPSNVYFVGHSLGGIIGTSFVSTNNKAVASAGYAGPLNEIKAAAMVTAGGGIARLLENSRSISPTILAGLTAAEAPQGSSNFELFMTVAQAAVDSADSVNFAEQLADLGTPVYLNEIFGDGSDRSTQDSTVPVAADTLYAGDYTAPLSPALPAPLSGTEPLIDLLEAEALGATGAANGNVAVRFTTGTHTTIISPEGDSGEAVFGEMASNIASLFGSVLAGAPAEVQFLGLPVVVQGDPTEE